MKKVTPVSARSLLALVRENSQFVQLVHDAEQARYASLERQTNLLAARISQQVPQLLGNQNGRTLLKSAGRKLTQRAKFSARSANPFGSEVVDVPQLPAGSNPPFASIIITTHNQGEVVRRAIDSALAQTIRDIEVVIYDDGSQPETVDFLRRLEANFGHSALRERHVHFIFAENKGVIAARNEALAAARGDYVVFLDPDDYLCPTYLEKAFYLARQHPDCAVVSPHTYVKRERNNLWRALPLGSPEIARMNHIPISSLIRRTALEQVGGFHPRMTDGYEDWELWYRMTQHGFTGVVLDDFVFEYTHSDTSGRNASAVQRNEELVQLIHDQPIDPKGGRPTLRRQGSTPPEDAQSLTADSPNRLLPRGKDDPIIFFVPWLIEGGGAEEFLRSLSSWLVDEDRTVIFCATSRPPHGSVDGRYRFRNISPFVYDLPTFLPDTDFPTFATAMLQEFASPIAVNVGSPWLYEFLDEHGTKGVEHVRFIDVLFNPVGHLPSMLAAEEHFSATLCAYQGLSDLLVSYFKVQIPVYTLYVGIKPASRPLVDHDANGALPTVGWLGRLSEEKRPELLRDAARHLPARADFVMAGSGPLEREVKAFARDTPNLTYVGFADSAPDFLSSVDLVVNTSNIEGISVTAMEAISLGTPVIAPDVGGMSELIIPGVNGYLFDPNEGLAGLMLELQPLIEDRERLRALQESTRASGLRPEFQEDEMAERFAQIIRAL